MVEGGGEQAEDVFGPIGEVVAAVIGDELAAVAVAEASDEILGGLVDEVLLPGFEGDLA